MAGKVSILQKAAAACRLFQVSYNQRGEKVTVRHRWVIQGGVALCSLLMIAGILIAGAGVRDWQRGSVIAHWPTVEAEVDTVRLVKSVFPPTKFSAARETYTREIRLRYTVNGNDYESSLVLPAEPPASTLGAQPHDPALPVAPLSHLTVHYDPADPRMTVIHPTSAREASKTIAIGAVVAVLAAAAIVFLRSRRT